MHTGTVDGLETANKASSLYDTAGDLSTGFRPSSSSLFIPSPAAFLDAFSSSYVLLGDGSVSRKSHEPRMRDRWI